MNINYTLEIINSRADQAGNRYWAFRFHDQESGKTVEGKISGGESNIEGIRFHWGLKNDWDRSIQVNRTEMKIREFDRLTKNWEYAGCLPEDMVKFIRARGIEPKVTEVAEKSSPNMERYEIQQEMDDEPTYIVDAAVDPDSEIDPAVITIAPHYGTPQMRKELAKKVRDLIKEQQRTAH